jgi:hypothetical protein
MKLYYKIISLFLLGIFLSTASADELSIRKEIAHRVENLFLNDNFEQLDLMSEKYRTTEERTESGIWKLTVFYGGFKSLTASRHKDMAYWASLKSRIDRWISLHPNSETALIVKGIILKRYAWAIRGTTWAHQVPEPVWKYFKENLIIAQNHMLNVRHISSRSPHWYVVVTSIKMGLNEDKKIFNDLIDEGLNRFPDYYALYFTAIQYLLPKWHGDKKQIEKFANAAVERTKKTDGMAMYTRIYWYASQAHYDEWIFVKSEIVWENFRQGIMDVLRDYPDSWNIQNFAFFSCLARDKELTRTLFSKMTEPMIESAWKKKKYFEYCKKYIST